MVFPAWAGMNRVLSMLLRNIICVPRVGGDEPLEHELQLGSYECSPRGRG